MPVQIGGHSVPFRTQSCLPPSASTSPVTTAAAPWLDRGSPGSAFTPLAAWTRRGCARRACCCLLRSAPALSIARPGALPVVHAVSLVLGGACGLLRPQLTLCGQPDCAPLLELLLTRVPSGFFPRTPWQPRSRGRCARSCSWKSLTRQTPRTASLLSSRESASGPWGSTRA